MKYGKIRIEDGNFIFAKHMMMNYLPCKDILWAYKRKEGVEGGAQKQFSTSSLVIITRRKKRYQFDLTDREIQDCIQLLKALNPNIVTGFPKGGRIPLQSLPNTRDLGALMTQTSPKRNTVSYVNRRPGHPDERLSSDDCDRLPYKIGSSGKTGYSHGGSTILRYTDCG